MAEGTTTGSGGRRRRRAVDLPMIAEMPDGWYGFGLAGIGWVSMAMAKVNGQPEIVGLRIDAVPMFVDESAKDVLDLPAAEQRQWAVDHAPPDAGPLMITADRLRALPLAKLRAAAAAKMAGDDPFGAFKKVARERGKALPDDHYQQVADVYRSAVERRISPLKAIQENWTVAPPTASKWVRRCRELGFLGWPERPGVAGYDSTHSPFTD